MPTLNLFTNVPVDPVIASDILKDATKAIAKTLSKPESYVMVLINGGVPIAFAGTEEAAAYGELISIGGLDGGVNGKLSSIVAEILQTKLNIDSNRFYIKFYDVQMDYGRAGQNIMDYPSVERLCPAEACFYRVVGYEEHAAAEKYLGKMGLLCAGELYIVWRPFFGFNGSTF